MLFLDIFEGDTGGVISCLRMIALFVFLCVVGFPWRSATIEKKGNRLVVLVKAGLMGISDIKRVYPLPIVKTWCYSDDTGLLGITVSSKNAGPAGGFVDWLSLRGMKPADLSFLLDRLGRNFKRSPPMKDG